MLTRTPNRYIIQFTDMTKQDANYENAESKSLRVHEDGHHAFFKYAARDYRILSVHTFARFFYFINLLV